MSQVTASSSTPNPPLRDTMAKPNCMNRIVQWFRDDETPTIRKVGALVLAALTLISIGFLVGQPFLVPGLSVGPLAAWANWERSALRKNEYEIRLSALLRAEDVWALQEMESLVGGKREFDRLPVLKLQEPKQFDSFQPEDLVAPVMRGVNGDQPFIAIKVKDADNEGKLEVFTFFQRKKPRGEWAHENSFLQQGPSILQNVLGTRNIGEKEKAIILQIVVLKNHPRFTLAE